MPASAPRITQKEIQEKVVGFLPESLFPGGAKSGWWAKMVQLNLEAKDIVIRAHPKPLRGYKK